MARISLAAFTNEYWALNCLASLSLTIKTSTSFSSNSRSSMAVSIQKFMVSMITSLGLFFICFKTLCCTAGTPLPNMTNSQSW